MLCIAKFTQYMLSSIKILQRFDYSQANQWGATACFPQSHYLLVKRSTHLYLVAMEAIWRKQIKNFLESETKRLTGRRKSKFWIQDGSFTLPFHFGSKDSHAWNLCSNSAICRTDLIRQMYDMRWFEEEVVWKQTNHITDAKSCMLAVSQTARLTGALHAPGESNRIFGLM